MRYFLELGYQGTNYHGWQRQKNGLSVQEVLEKTLSTLLRQPIGIMGSGRTDAGVHASQQFAHFNVSDDFVLPGHFLHALNCLLPPDIAVYDVFPVRADDHARYSATFRYYQYRISRRKNPLQQNLVCIFPHELDLGLLNEAASLLLRHTDFESFSKVRTGVKHFHCTIMRSEWQKEGHELVFHVKANRFLYGMVRALVGTMLDVGQGRMSVSEFETIILARDRRKAGRAAPPNGLTLVEVGYPEEIMSERVKE